MKRYFAVLVFSLFAACKNEVGGSRAHGPLSKEFMDRAATSTSEDSEDSTDFNLSSRSDATWPRGAMETKTETVGDWFGTCSDRISKQRKVIYGVGAESYEECERAGVTEIWVDADYNNIGTHRWDDEKKQMVPRDSYTSYTQILAKIEAMLDRGKIPSGGYYIGELGTPYNNWCIQSSGLYYQGLSLNAWAAKVVELHTKRGLPKPKVVFTPYSAGPAAERDRLRGLGLDPLKTEKENYEEAMSLLSSDITHVTWQTSSGAPAYPGKLLMDMATFVNQVQRKYGKVSQTQWELYHHHYNVAWVACGIQSKLQRIGFERISIYSYLQLAPLEAEIEACERNYKKQSIASVLPETTPHSSYSPPTRVLIDGILGPLSNPTDPAWMGFNPGNSVRMVVDLGSVKEIDLVKVHTIRKRNWGIDCPSSLKIEVSNDGSIYRDAGKWNAPWFNEVVDGDHDYRITNHTKLNQSGRYLRLTLSREDYSPAFIFVSEISVHAKKQ